MLLSKTSTKRDKQDMARLSRDALMVLAHMNAHDEYLITDIAINVFRGIDINRPKVIRPAALERAKNAARALAARKQAKVSPNTKEPVSIRSTDPTGGTVQVQSVMNLFVRSGVDRRANPDRREEPHPEAVERRAPRDRRIIRPVSRPTPTVSRDNEVKAAKFPSPFDIKNDFKL